ncbi:FG-GAP repeat domain-containing protein [Paenibacillus physcomitrellae]|uniref:VCBS repeat-containing protein n=1 Tax=Paenibacillus physcomitrellae TaxID=1619311 RepID=A0ABQ1FQJ1_9BACL|nr:VCBS repeat-containing protein [Paenibacillus physcomitrellae]GGA25186.1 hypothetical protein GCM10010917_07630 [Paenibacillus physcomitrellae]
MERVMRLKGRNRLGLLLVCLLMFVLSGCNLDFDPKASMKAPQLTSDNESLKSVVNQYLAQLPSGGTLIRPNDDGTTSLIRVVDLNNDGHNEALIFYETPDDPVPIHGVVFVNNNGTWSPKAKIDGEGQVLESLRLADLTNDGKIDIIAGYSSGEQQVQKGLSVYSFTDGKLEKILVELPYTYYVVNDLNADGKTDLSIVYFKKNEFSNVTTYQYDGKSFEQLDQLDLDSNINGYYNMVTGKIASGGEQGIMLDVSLNAAGNSSYTLVITMKSGKLLQVLGQDQTYKDDRIPSGDVNGDGILEYGLLQKPAGWDGFSLEDIPWLYNYYQVDSEGKPVWEEFLGLPIPTDLIGKVTIDTKSIKNQYIKFVRTDNGHTVLEVKYFTLSQWDRNKADWKLLERTTDRVIGYRGLNTNAKTGWVEQ